MTREELNIWQEKVDKGIALSVKISAAKELIVAINRLRVSKDIGGAMTTQIKNLILQHTAETFDEIYFCGDKFAREILGEINIDAIVNETWKQVLKLVQAKKAEIEKEFEEYKI